MADYSKKLEDLLDHHLISNEELVKKKELGGIGYVLNGNMCLGIYEDSLVVRVGKELANALQTRPGIKLYAPGNPELVEFIMVDPAIYTHSKALRKFVTRAIQYTSKLPPKRSGDSHQEL